MLRSFISSSSVRCLISHCYCCVPPCTCSADMYGAWATSRRNCSSPCQNRFLKLSVTFPSRRFVRYAMQFGPPNFMQSVLPLCFLWTARERGHRHVIGGCLDVDKFDHWLVVYFAMSKSKIWYQKGRNIRCFQKTTVSVFLNRTVYGFCGRISHKPSATKPKVATSRIEALIISGRVHHSNHHPTPSSFAYDRLQSGKKEGHRDIAGATSATKVEFHMAKEFRMSTVQKAKLEAKNWTCFQFYQDISRCIYRVILKSIGQWWGLSKCRQLIIHMCHLEPETSSDCTSLGKKTWQWTPPMCRWFPS